MKLFVRILEEPLVHFLFLAGALALFARLFVTTPLDDESDRTIRVSEQRIKSLFLSHQRTWQRPPTKEELDGLIQDFIKEEIYYREAQAMDLDKDDTLIRRRLRQKMEFIAEDLAQAMEPSEEDLQEFLDEHQDSFRVEQRVTFRQVYLSPSRRGDSLDVDAKDLLARLGSDKEVGDPAELGDSTLLPYHSEDLSKSDVANQFGPEFAEEVFAAAVGEWSGPVRSGYGAHIVLVEGKSAGRVPPLKEVRKAVRREWYAAEQESAKGVFYKSLLEKYDVVVEELELGGAEDAAVDPGGKKSE